MVRSKRQSASLARERRSLRRMGVGIMLQQTQAETVIPYYRRFMQALPDIKSLAACTEDS